MLRYGLQTTTLGVCQQSIRPAILIPADTVLGTRHSVILLAEDEAIIRNLVTLLMQREGHFVLSAADGQEGLELSRLFPALPRGRVRRRFLDLLRALAGVDDFDDEDRAG